VSEPISDRVAMMPGAAALPRDNGTLVFSAPWEGRALAIAVDVVERLAVPWDEFRRRLIAAIAEEPGRPYYESWTAALEQLLVDFDVCTPAALDAATPKERPSPSGRASLSERASL
jgi:nitrile hydratase accessory protein